MVNSSYQKGCSIYLITVFHGIAIVAVSSCINLTSLGTCHQVPLLLHNRYGILLNWSGLGVISQLQIKSKFKKKIYLPLVEFHLMVDLKCI